MPIEVKYDEAVARQFRRLQISTAVKAWNALTGAISEVKLSHRVWIPGSPSAAWSMLHDYKFAIRHDIERTTR